MEGVGAINTIAFNLILVVGILGIITFLSYRGMRNRYALRDKFLEDEKKANAARARDVEAHFYFKPDLEALPIRETNNAEIDKRQKHVLKRGDLTMLRFPEKMTNLQLKNLYGLANLERIVTYENNYNTYVSALVEWADTLLSQGGEQDKADAVLILEETVALDSEFRKTYMHLANYYSETGKYENLNHLIDRVTVLFSDEGIKKSLVQYIMDKREA